MKNLVNVYCNHCGFVAADIFVDTLLALTHAHQNHHGFRHVITTLPARPPLPRTLHLSIGSNNLVSLWDDAAVRARGASGERFVDLQLTEEQSLLLEEGGE
jgi:hypothetical protein